ncbi:TPA: hypothetical protein ACGAHT_004599 [Salmonella enterica subsp. enterica serovar Newport]
MSVKQESVTVAVELDSSVAWALAQFCKRTTHHDCVERSQSEDEAYLMMDGVNGLMKALAEAGYAPR